MTMVLKTSDVVTALGADIPKNRIRIGAVILPAPTPVAPMASAIRNPARISTVSEFTLYPIGMDRFHKITNHRILLPSLVELGYWLPCTVGTR